MGSSIRSHRDQRWSARTHRDRRDNTHHGVGQKTYDARHTAHSSSTKPPVLDGEPSNTDHKIDHGYEVIRDQLAPRTQTLSRNAVLSDRREFFYYARKRTGRRCSCYSDETSPDNLCPICIGTGIVAGYEKHGTKTEILDFTSPDLVMVNCEPNFDEDTRPVYLRLKEGAESGFIEADLPILANIGEVDTYILSQPIFNRGTTVVAIDPTGASAVINEKEDFEPFLAFDKVKIRIEFEKIDDRPIISHFMLRYKTKENLQVFGDVARAEEDFVLTEFGVHEAYQEIPIFFDGRTIQRIRNEDILFRICDQRKFRIVVTNENRFGGNVLTSVDTKARYLIPNLDPGPIKNLLI